jgi:hypothetical protein
MLSMSKRRRKKGLLDSQKLKRRHRLFPLLKKLLPPVLVIAGGVGISLWLKPRLSSSGFNVFRGDERPELLVLSSIGVEDDAPIREAYSQLPSINGDSLPEFAERLHQKMGLRSITLVRTAPQRLSIGTEPFAAALIVELDRRRYATDDGIIFGEVTDGTASPLPILKGLDRRQMMVRTSNGTYSVSAGNQKIIDEALLAIHEGSKYNIKYRSLVYDDFRGISGDLEASNYRVTLGFKPYSNKYMKLEKIILSLKERGLSSATIEVDYKGKAFVKESVL